MQNSVLVISENFRKMAIRSVYSIILFFFTYIALVILGLLTILLCGVIAYGLVAFKLMIPTAALAIGFLGMGFMIFFFLIKFIFSSPKKVDRSHLTEITEQDQPALFAMIREIVEEVQTNFPKKIYLSSEVNASVFYDSNFWSMFFPVRKNLQIGLGLMNSVTALELKAILAHEFGHFSQRSMKVGSYVYNVNKVIYNMLYDNDNYAATLDRWSNMSSYFVIFSRGSIWVIRGIQWVLMKVYRVLNLNYMALSREMEFHADAVAASVTGSAPLASSLLRLNLADESLSTVFNYYNEKISVSEKTNNFYPQQAFILNRIAEAQQLPMEDGLPVLSVNRYKQFNKTKLMLDDQWSSHPSTEQRVAKLEELNLPTRNTISGIAIDLLAQKERVEEMITAKLFETVQFEKTPIQTALPEFEEQYLKREKENNYPIIYKGYFDARDPYTGFTAEEFKQSYTSEFNLSTLINDQTAAELNDLATAISDKATLEKINESIIEVNTFDYDGTKYEREDAQAMITFLDEKIAELNTTLEEKDKMIFEFFYSKATESGLKAEFMLHANAFKDIAGPMERQKDAYINMANATYFMQNTTPFDQIKENLIPLKKVEIPFKEQVKLILEGDMYNDVITTEVRSAFEEYLEKDWKYFGYDMYYDKEVEALFNVMTEFTLIIFKKQIELKRSLLEFQANMINEDVAAV